ncbi:YihY/virulence factor BrkB family protein [bacterium]|nr:YihY/virulence factor BrkB family protein [bacterium]
MKFKRIFNIIKNIVKSAIDNDFFGMASEMGFMLVIGIFPFMLFLTDIFGWMGRHSFIAPLAQFLQEVMPGDVIRLLQTVLNEVWFFTKGGLVATLGFCITVILSTNAIAIVLKGLNRAYKVEETRSFIYTRMLSLVMVFVNALVLFLSINLIVFGKVIIKFLVTYLGLTVHVGNVVLFTRWPVAFVALFVMAYLHYYILPDLGGKENVRRRSAIPGAIFFTISWLLGSWGFSIYINNLHTYNFVYGTIGGFAVLMVWLYYTSILMLIGGELNSQLFSKLERKEIIMEKRNKDN